MRVFVTILTLSLVAIANQVTAQTVQQTRYQETYKCSKCGKTHTRWVTVPVSTSEASVVQTSATTETTNQVAPAVASEPTVSNPTKSKSDSQGSKLTVVSRDVGETPDGVTNVLETLNAQRARQGIGSLKYDPHLQAVANRRVLKMVASGLKGHPSGSFSPGRYEGVGWSSSHSPSGVRACYTSDSRMRYAGAAMARGRDGFYFVVVYR